ncbi:MAG: sugar transferase [Actinobacteria bacterium]|nr:sugar transferase [Actinomycetota bacterium]
MSRNNTYLNYKIYLFILDTVLVAGSFYIALMLNKYFWKENYGYLIVIYLITFIFYLYFENYKYKSLKLIRGFLVGNIFINTIIFGLIALFIFITPIGSKTFFINIFKYYFLIFLVSSVIIRIIVFEAVFKNINRIRSFNRNAVILGITEESKKLYEDREDIRRNNGLDIIGFIDLKKLAIRGSIKKNVIGKIDDIISLSNEYNFRDVFLVSNNLATPSLLKIIEDLRSKNYILHVNEKNLKELFNVNLYDIYGTAMKFIDFSIERHYYKRFLKVVLDRIVAFIILIFLSPLFLILPVMIRSTSKGPAFFIGERIGFNQVKFKIFKFRSMKYSTADNIEVHKESVKAFYTGKESGKIKKFNSSKRVTGVGRFLRKYSLDEIPQFINALIGNMSIIGPRPCMDYEVQYFKGWRKYRFAVQPGITGLWQAYGRSRVNFEGMSVFDYYYYSNCSFSLDLKIGIDTIKVFIFGIGGY